MKVAVLFSGGKDSVLAVHRCVEAGHTVTALVHVVPQRPEDSRLYHLPNAAVPAEQAASMGIPFIQVFSSEGAEKEIIPLQEVLRNLKKTQKVEAVISGAVGSTYQSTRFEKMADELGLECLHPLWQIDPAVLWKELLSKKFDVRMAAVSAQGLNAEWLGKKITTKEVKALFDLSKKFGMHPAGEGGEFETVVLDAPLFRHQLLVKKAKASFLGTAGSWDIQLLEEKKKKKRRF